MAGESCADLVSRFEYGEWIQHEADGDAGRATRQEVPGIRQCGENGGMTLRVALADRPKERRGGHEPTDLIQAGKVQGESRDVSGIRYVSGHVSTYYSLEKEWDEVGMYRIKVADVPRQRPSTPDEETMARVV